MTVRGPYEITHYWMGLSTDTKPTEGVNVGDEFLETNTRLWYIYSGSAWTIKDPGSSYTTSTDPASSVAVTTAIVDAYAGVVITLTAAGNAQTIANPTIVASGKEFIVANNDTSTDSITVNTVVIQPGEAQKYFWDGSAWLTLEAISASQISATPHGAIAAVQVQAYLDELEDEKVAKAGDTMTGDLTINGDLSSGIDVITQAATDTLTAQECRGTQISNYSQSAENTQTLPTAAAGLNGMVIIGTAGAGAFHLKAGASDKIYLDGTALDDGDKCSLATPAVGDFFTFVAFQTGASAYDWIVRTGEGTLTDGGA